jgi:hypothetical protein
LLLEREEETVLKVKVVYAETQQEFEQNMNNALADLEGKRVVSIFYTTDSVVRVNKTDHPPGSSVNYYSIIMRYYNGLIEYEQQEP